MEQKSKRAVAVGLAAASLATMGAQVIRHEPGPKEAARRNRAEPVGLPAGDAIVDAEWDLPETRNERVDFFIDFLSGKKYDEARLWQERLGRYAPMIQAKLRERGMPEDLVFLAMIESGFDPNAYSSAHAAGVWQFIEGTGERYGLEVSEYVDERRDPVKATDAALDYLSDLYDQFGSWYLAAAAYNTGEGRIERILQERADGRRGDDDLYWQISPYIPRETRDYVPLMLAAGHIGKEPARFGFRDLNYQTPLSYDTVRVPPGTPLRTVARAAGVDPGEVEALNPHLVRKMTPPDRSWEVRVPDGTADRFAANFEAVLRQERG